MLRKTAEYKRLLEVYSIQFGIQKLIQLVKSQNVFKISFDSKFSSFSKIPYKGCFLEMRLIRKVG